MCVCGSGENGAPQLKKRRNKPLWPRRRRLQSGRLLLLARLGSPNALPCGDVREHDRPLHQRVLWLLPVLLCWSDVAHRRLVLPDRVADPYAIPNRVAGPYAEPVVVSCCYCECLRCTASNVVGGLLQPRVAFPCSSPWLLLRWQAA